MLAENTKAPVFALPDKDGNMVSPGDFPGKRVVLYFYPKDNTSGCTKQAVAFAQSYETIKALGAEVIGISKDSAVSHRKFAEKYELPFILVSDPELEAITAYDVWHEKKMAGKTYMGVVRTTYIISPQGNIEKSMGKVKPETNAAEVIRWLQEQSQQAKL